MAWIESHQSLLTHRKTARLARRLGVSRITTIGHLQALWWWAVDNAPTGDLSALDAADMADGACWEGEAEPFLDALTYAGFVDADADGLRLHNWDKYTGRLIERREANAERMRQARAKPVPDTKTPRAAHVPRTLPARAGATVPNRTQPNRTQPDPETRTGDDARTAAAVAPPERSAEAVPKKHPRDLGPLVEAFRAAGLSPPKFTGAEAKAAADLLGLWPPADLAACWQDHASGDYGDDFSRRELSFGYLSLRNRVGNWEAWRKEQAPTEAPVYRNGLTHLPREPGVYPQGVRCRCSHVYSVMAQDCPKCGLAQVELRKVTA